MAKIFKNTKTGETLDWNKMCNEFTTEETGGALTDEQISNMSDDEFVEAVEQYTDYRAVDEA